MYVHVGENRVCNMNVTRVQLACGVCRRSRRRRRRRRGEEARARGEREGNWGGGGRRDGDLVAADE